MGIYLHHVKHQYSIGCVIEDNKPLFLGVTEILKKSTINTKEILGLELEYKKQDLENQWHYSSLEKIFIENRIYRDIEEVETWEGVLNTIANGLKPHSSKLRRKITERRIEPRCFPQRDRETPN